jgi:predicted lipoprotein with Yx(FWY)xxD motif
MKTNLSKNLIFLTVVIFTSIQYGCMKQNDSTVYEVQLATSSTLGQYLTDKDGNTLYFFSNDYNGRNSCSGGCAVLWPYFYVADLTMDNVGPGLDIADFDTINVNGTSQLRYKTWPLYYYAPLVGNVNVRESAGQTTGEGLGNVWFVAKTDYSIMLANTQLVGKDGKNYTGAYVEGTGKTNYFTDGKGVTLYIFKVDSLNHNKYTKSDFSNNGIWPIYETSSVVVPSTLDKTLFNNITVFGKKQLTYKGWPLYYYGSDNMIRGNNKGVSVPTPGVWPVAVKGLSPAPGI